MTGLRKIGACIALTAACVISAGSASACPNCKMANETDSRKPRAYMYSILFMIGMPATIFTGFAASFYRMNRRTNLSVSADTNTEPGSETPEA